MKKLLILFLLFAACLETEAQQLLCQNQTFSVTINGQVWVRPGQIDNGSSGYLHYRINGQDSVLYNCSDVGIPDTVLFTGTDALGNIDTCVAIVSIIDAIPPLAICQNVTVWLNATQSATVFPVMISNGPSDNCGVGSFFINGQSAVVFGPAQLGPNPVVLTVFDMNGNSSNCTAIITVMDTVPEIRGRVVSDSNMNCVSDATEAGLAGAIIRLQSASRNYYFISGNSGAYSGILDTGLYTASINHPYLPAQFCPVSAPISITNPTTVQTLDWQYQGNIQCPVLTVDLASPFIRTNNLSNYQVRYCNTGTTPAQNAYIDITLDPSLVFFSSSIPQQTLGNNVYRFSLGTVNSGYCGNFNIYFNVMQGVYVGQTHCSEAHIYPDTICLSGLWNGAEMSLEAQCQNDTVFFEISNQGASMSVARNYYLYEDSLITSFAPYFLTAGQSMTLAVAAQPGKTYRLVAEQEQGYPSLLGDSTVTAFIENCNALAFPNMSRGFGTNFSNGNSSPFIAVDCRQNIGSYDPNDKSAQPEGYGSEHYIYDHTSIDYTVRFQNTGTDTAFNIYVLDTLSEYLDPLTLQPGASSHTYTWQILPNNVLKLRFDNIMLPDSNVNQVTSNGFFKYRISQKPGNPLGAVIENSAAIYFDNNPPVITNTTFHTIGADFVPIASATLQSFENIDFLLFPNPTSERLQLRLPAADRQSLSLFDARGVLLKKQACDALSGYTLDTEDLAPAVYFLRLETEGGSVCKPFVKN